MNYLSNLSPEQLRRIEQVFMERESKEREEAEQERKRKSQSTPKPQVPVPVKPQSTQSQTSRIVTPVNIADPENYLILKGQTHGNYSYNDCLVSIDRYHQGKNWNDSHKELAKANYSMLSVRQFVDFLALLKSGKAHNGKGDQVSSTKLESIYKDITEVKDPWRAEWLDADFKVEGGKLRVHYNHFLDKTGKLQFERNEELESCLMQDKLPGISLEDWINNANSQGFPKSSIKAGKLYYRAPMSDNNSVARFCASSGRAGLSCYRSPSLSDTSLGVRLVAKNFGGKP